MRTRIVIGKHSFQSIEDEQHKSDKKQLKSKLTKEFESSEDILKSFDDLKGVIENYLKEFDDQVEIATFRITARIKATTTRQKPIGLRDEGDFSKLVELVKMLNDQEEATLTIKLDSKEKKHHKKHKKEKRKRNEVADEDDGSDEEIDNKKKQIKTLTEMIENSKQQLKGLQSELSELKVMKSNENQITGMMNSVSLDSQPKEENTSSSKTIEERQQIKRERKNKKERKHDKHGKDKYEKKKKHLK